MSITENYFAALKNDSTAQLAVLVTGKVKTLFNMLSKKVKYGTIHRDSVRRFSNLVFLL
jgi:hypothetical protein